MIKIMLPFLRKNKRSIGIIVLVSLISLVVNVFISYYTGNFIDSISLHKSMIVLYNYILVFLLLVFTDVLVKRFFLVYKSKVEEKTKFDIYKEYVEHLNRISVENFEQFNPTYLNQRLNTDIAVICSFVFETFLDCIFSILKIIIILVIMFILRWQVAVISVGMIVAYTITFKIFVEPIRKNNYQLKEISATYFQTCNEQLTLYKEIRVTSNYESSVAHIKNRFKQYFNIMMTYVKVSVKYTVTLEVISMSFLILILFVCGKGIIESSMTVGVLIILNSYYNMLSGSVDKVCDAFKCYQETLNSVIRMKELLVIPEEKNGNYTIMAVKSIILKNVEFSYQNDSVKPIFSGLNIRFIKGKTYAILGQNGTGKTSLINAILYLYRNNIRGKIYINDKATEDVDMVDFRSKQVAICMQNEKLPDMTVKEYFHYYGILDFDDMYEKIRDYGIESMYFSDKLNIEEYMSRSIYKLSGGEKQKILLLRALVKEASVIILDEINSNLDVESISLLCEFINKVKKNKIIITISHNTRIIEVSDVKINL